MAPRRVLFFALGGLAAVLVFALAFAGVGYFVPRFLNYARYPEHRLVIIIAAAVILLMNIFRRYRRRRRK